MDNDSFRIGKVLLKQLILQFPRAVAVKKKQSMFRNRAIIVLRKISVQHGYRFKKFKNDAMPGSHQCICL